METAGDPKPVLRGLVGMHRDILKCVSDMASLLLANAYTYRIAMEAESSQVPVLSREQHVDAALDLGFEADSPADLSIIKLSTLPNPESGKQITLGTGGKNMFGARVASSSKSVEDSTTASAVKSPPPSDVKAGSTLFSTTP